MIYKYIYEIGKYMKTPTPRPLVDVNTALAPRQEDAIVAALQNTLALQHIVASDTECANIARTLRRIAPPDDDVLPRKSA
ncbi:hypothetical protein GCM10027287_06880 [Bordetella muralis]